MARYLITGIAGFVGSWLARDLIARGETVRGINNLSSGSLTNLAGIEDRIEFLHADLRSPRAVEVACKDVDYIFHLARSTLSSNPSMSRWAPPISTWTAPFT